jgi:ribosome maturation factor RimP
MTQTVAKADSRLDAVERIIDRVLENTDLFRVETKLGRSGAATTVRVFIDGDEGVTIDQCASISRSLRAELILDDVLGPDFRIDVSSPGLDRPLKLKRQYRRHLGRMVDIAVKSSNGDSPTHLRGTLESVEGDVVVIRLDDEAVEIQFDKIERAVVMPSL